MTAPDRARLRELLDQHDSRKRHGCDGCGADAFVDALPALLDALDEAEKALRLISNTERHKQDPPDWRLDYEIAREALARIGAE